MFNVKLAVEKFRRLYTSKTKEYIEWWHLEQILLAGQEDEPEVDIIKLKKDIIAYIDARLEMFSEKNFEGRLCNVEMLEQRIAKLEQPTRQESIERRLLRLENIVNRDVLGKPVTDDKLDPKVWDIGARVVVKKSNDKPSECDMLKMGGIDVMTKKQAREFAKEAFAQKPIEFDLLAHDLSIIDKPDTITIPRAVAEEWIKSDFTDNGNDAEEYRLYEAIKKALKG